MEEWSGRNEQKGISFGALMLFRIKRKVKTDCVSQMPRCAYWTRNCKYFPTHSGGLGYIAARIGDFSRWRILAGLRDLLPNTTSTWLTGLERKKDLLLSTVYTPRNTRVSARVTLAASLPSSALVAVPSRTFVSSLCIQCKVCALFANLSLRLFTQSPSHSRRLSRCDVLSRYKSVARSQT